MENKRFEANDYFRKAEYEKALYIYQESLKKCLHLKNICLRYSHGINLTKIKILKSFLQNLNKEIAYLALNCATTFIKKYNLKEAIKYSIFCRKILLKEFEASKNQEIIKLSFLSICKLCVIFLKIGNLNEFNKNHKLLQQYKSYHFKMPADLRKSIESTRHSDILSYRNYIQGESNSDMHSFYQKNEMDNFFNLPSQHEVQKYLQNYLQIGQKENDIRIAENTYKKEHKNTTITRFNTCFVDNFQDNTMQEMDMPENDKIKVMNKIFHTQIGKYTIEQHAFTYDLLSPKFILEVLNFSYKIFVNGFNVKWIERNDYFITNNENEILYKENKKNEIDKIYSNKDMENIEKKNSNIELSNNSIQESSHQTENKESNIQDLFINKYKRVHAFKSEKNSNQNKSLFIFGDTHGNLINTYLIVKKITNNFSENFQSQIVFNGDFVDRGEMGAELVIFLLLLKIFYDGGCFNNISQIQEHQVSLESLANNILYKIPLKTFQSERVILNRGNHEYKSLNFRFTFYKELNNKYRLHGDVLHKFFNEIFCTLGICVVAGDIFITHGGLPREQFSLTDIESIDRKTNIIQNFSDNYNYDDTSNNKKYKEISKCQCHEKKSSEQQIKINNLEILEAKSAKFHLIKRNNIHAGLLWSDPYDIEYFEKSRRGIAIHFGWKLTKTFFLENGINFLVRSHEFVENCFKKNHNGNVVTIFSAVDYDNNVNDAAFLEIKGKYYVVRSFR